MDAGCGYYYEVTRCNETVPLINIHFYGNSRSRPYWLIIERHCQLYELHLTYTNFRELTLLPPSCDCHYIDRFSTFISISAAII
jgi:hypothetical protein